MGGCPTDWVKLCKVPNQLTFGLTHRNGITEVDWDWNWSHPAPSSGSQQYNCNQAAKKRDLTLFFAVLACPKWDWAGLQQTILKKYVLCCWIPGNSIPKETTACSSSPALWAEGFQRCCVKYGRKKPFCRTRLSQCWHPPASATYSIPEEALLCLWGMREDAGQMGMLAQGGLCTAAWLWPMLAALCLYAWADRGALQQHRKEKI